MFIREKLNFNVRAHTYEKYRSYAHKKKLAIFAYIYIHIYTSILAIIYGLAKMCVVE